MKTMQTETAANFALRAVTTARAHIGHGSMVSSAELALWDAEDLFVQGDYRNAAHRAMMSLSYSVGILHPAYDALAQEAK